MKKIVLISFIILCVLAIGVVYAQNETEDTDQIPNYVIEEPEDNNGRAVRLDSDNESAEDLNAVERKVIRRDTITSNTSLIDPAK